MVMSFFELEIVSSCVSSMSFVTTMSVASPETACFSSSKVPTSVAPSAAHTVAGTRLRARIRAMSRLAIFFFMISSFCGVTAVKYALA